MGGGGGGVHSSAVEETILGSPKKTLGRSKICSKYSKGFISSNWMESKSEAKNQSLWPSHVIFNDIC